jgi:hypothetical protein
MIPYASIQAAVEDLTYGIRAGLEVACPDPKGLGPALDTELDDETRRRISEAALLDWSEAYRAIQAEAAQDEATAIGHWGNALGPTFPRFGLDA